MAKFGVSGKPAKQGSPKFPGPGYMSVQASPPGGKPVGKTPGGGNAYTDGVHVRGFGGTGTERGTRKPFGKGDVNC